MTAEPERDPVIDGSARVTGWRVPDRERDRLLALHRVSMVVAQQRQPDDVLREALKGAVTLVGGDAGSIYRWIPERQRLRSVMGHGRYESLIRGELQVDQGVAGRTFAAQTPVIVNDYPNSALGTADSREAGLQKSVAVPISHGGVPLGVMAVGSYDAGQTFDPDDARLLELFAAVVAIALENAELYAQLESRLDRIRTLNRLARLVSTSLDLDEVLPRIAEAAAELTGSTFATFWLADDDSQMLRLASTSGQPSAEHLRQRQLRYGEGAAGWVAQRRQPLVVDDVFLDGRSRNLDWWRRVGLKASLTMPVAYGPNLVAVLSLNGQEPFRLNAQDQEMLESFLAQAASAIRNASLFSTMRRNQEQLQQIIDHSPAAISLKGLDGRYVLANRSWRTRLFADNDVADGSQPIGRIDADLFPPERAERTASRDRHVLGSGDTVEYEATVIEHGNRRTYLSIKFPLLDLAGQPYAVCTISTDISERKRSEEEIATALEVQCAANDQLQQLSQAKSDFVSIVSHEFRSPLTGIQGFSEMMRDNDLSAEEVREFSADINREAERLNRMIGELLDLDRMESGQMTLQLGEVDLAAIVSQVVGSARPRAPRHLLRAQITGSPPVLAADEDKLTQVVVNLVDNAIKYSPNGGEITVSVSSTGEAIQLRVQDEGLGIAPDALETIFERYRRIELATHPLIGGTGLGLPIVRQIVELHGGQVWAESVPGQGSAFHVTLPLAGPVAGVLGRQRDGN